MLCLKRKDVWLVSTMFIVCAQAGSPSIANSTCGSYSVLSEDFNGTVCSLNIKDSDAGDHITVRSNSDDTSIYFNIIRDGGTNDVWIEVTVKQPLDRETLGSMIKLELIITDKQHNGVPYEHSVYITDVNDNSPEFKNLPYKLEIDELPCYNASIVFTNIVVTDKDSGTNGMVTFSMMTSQQAYEYSSTFSIDPIHAAVTLDACLDYEKNSYYHFVIVAKDGGGLNSTADLIIHVKDVQDEPPFFTGKYRKALNGSLAKGKEIIRVYAVDGDLGLSTEISYSIMYSSCGDGLFSIDTHTGVVYAAMNINSTTGAVSQQFGFCILTIEASEIQTPFQKQYGNTTAETDVILTLHDDIDNTPTQTNENVQYSTTDVPPTTKIPLSCHERWDFDNPCNKSNVLNGVTKFPHPNSIYKFLICDFSGKTFSANCPRNEVFNARCSMCALPNQTFPKSCVMSKDNPCSKENIVAGNLTFPHPGSTSKYIRCDNEGNAWEEECLSGSFWDQSNLICVLPEAYNPCHIRGSSVQSLYPHYCNPRLYVQCGINGGHPFVHSCPKNYVFLHYDLTCVPPGFPGSEYLRNTCN